MNYATTTNTRTLYTIARRERDSREYVTIAHVVDERTAASWITHSGVKQRDAADLIANASEYAYAALMRERESAPSASAMLALPSAVHGDMIDAVEIGPRGESFRVVATIVSAPGVPVA